MLLLRLLLVGIRQLDQTLLPWVFLDRRHHLCSLQRKRQGWLRLSQCPLHCHLPHVFCEALFHHGVYHVPPIIVICVHFAGTSENIHKAAFPFCHAAHHAHTHTKTHTHSQGMPPPPNAARPGMPPQPINPGMPPPQPPGGMQMPPTGMPPPHGAPPVAPGALPQTGSMPPPPSGMPARPPMPPPQVQYHSF